MARKKDPEGVKTRILEVALKFFSEKGFEATTMQDIVEYSGLSKGAIYYHFKNKTEIYESLYESLNLNPLSCYYDLEKEESLSAAERMEAFLLTLVRSPEKRIYAEAVRNHKNPNLVEMTLRITTQEMSKYLSKMINDGIQEGIYASVDVQMISELFGLLVDIWLDPSINENLTEEFFDRKLDVIQKTFELHGVPLITPSLRAALKEYCRTVNGFSDSLPLTENSNEKTFFNQ